MTCFLRFFLRRRLDLLKCSRTAYHRDKLSERSCRSPRSSCRKVHRSPTQYRRGRDHDRRSLLSLYPLLRIARFYLLYIAIHLVILIYIVSRWRRMRKAAHEGLNKGVVHNYHRSQATEAILLACGILSRPENWLNHLRRNAASSVMSMVYDHPPIASEDDVTVKNINDFVARLARAALPGAHFVEFFPWMLNIPSRCVEYHSCASELFASELNIYSLLLAWRSGNERRSNRIRVIQKCLRTSSIMCENAWYVLLT